MVSSAGAVAAATAAGKRAKERRHQLRDALRRHHPTARRLVLIAIDDLIAAPSIAMASRPATAIAYPERVTSMRSNYHIPVFKCGIRGKAATDSDGRRPPIPIESGHPIRTNAATLLIG
ncbi:hypothetical protein [Bradyrhizobium sp. 174]|uniref:hypothetical protein n=1 Tax=Bradyrhizobium sp. 174 TaxID=2782645 RepID=UPI001FFB4D06|nr:hypothetical protein [Bradyrhizobium sp. 174]